MKFRVTRILDKETGLTVKWKLDSKPKGFHWWPVWNNENGSRYYASYDDVKDRIFDIMDKIVESNTEHKEEFA